MGPLRLRQLLLLLLLTVASSLFIYLKRAPPMDPSAGATALRKIVVTGSNGRVGKRVVLAALARGYHVVGVDHSALATADDRDLGSNFTFLQADLRDYNETLKALQGCEAVIHLAAYPQPGDYKVVVHNSNVVISWNVLRAAAEASSVNAITLVYSQQPIFDFFPIDETHPTLPDEPYGLSKVIMELQADTIVRRFKNMRVASLRLHWSGLDLLRAKNDLWGYVQQDSAAEAFLLAITQPTDKWPSASEAFFIAAAETTYDGESSELIKEYWPDRKRGFFDCSKAKELLGWVHNPDLGAASSIAH
ncbi:hypothetical protein B0H14DRAFT_2665953 [Mycena olivaceomarginata]|nr:hypothetical protein B0H14DRAFT_2665953 [Mycena olivaceomarginata]